MKARRNEKLTLTILTIALAAVVYGQPSSTVWYLMNDPVTMFDWGMSQLQHRSDSLDWPGLDLVDPAVLPTLATVDYDWGKSQLILQVVMHPRYRSFQKSTQKEVCREVILRLKQHFGEGLSESEMKTFGPGNAFYHHQFKKPDQPQTLAEDIDRISTLRVNLYTSTTDKAPFQPSQSCSSDLRKKEVVYFTVSEQ